MDSTQVPAGLQEAAQWVCWCVEDRDGHPTKVPLDPVTGDYASVAEPATWHAFESAVAQYRRNADVDGVGFVFTADDPYVGVDLDDCRDPATGHMDDWAVEIIQRLASYTEVSPSGTGVHIIVQGAVPAGGNRRGDLEMYDHDRYFTVTGDRIPETPLTVEKRPEKLRAIHTEYIASPEQDMVAVSLDERPTVELSDAELVEKAMNAANGDKFQRLWNGDTSEYPSHSEADQALCNLLAFWTGGDPQRIERLFGQSGLVRDKWRNRPDYRERTIRKAIRDCSAFYDPGEQE